VEFETSPGEINQVTAIPVYRKIAAPSNLKINNLPGSGKITLSWDASPDAGTYRVYKYVTNSPDYKLIQSGVKTNSFESLIPEKKKNDRWIFRVTAVDKTGRESTDVNLNMIS
jgi:fibronectin type 3 domain-containing protein